MRAGKVVEIRATRSKLLQLLHHKELHLEGILLILVKQKTTYRISTLVKSKRIHQMLSLV